MLIENLSNHRSLVPKLACWHFDAFGPLTGSGSLAEYKATLEWYAESDSIPRVLVAISAGELAGSTSLVPCDLPIRRDLTP